MKIRKVFESYEYSHEAYKKILSWHDGKQVDLKPIDGLERNKLVEIFTPLRIPEKKTGPFHPNRIAAINANSRTKVICGKSINRIDIDILCDNDEWYYVRIISMNGGNSTTHSYFKCDQWDGLISCIENEVIGKIGK